MWPWRRMNPLQCIQAFIIWLKDILVQWNAVYPFCFMQFHAVYILCCNELRIPAVLCLRSDCTDARWSYTVQMWHRDHFHMTHHMCDFIQGTEDRLPFWYVMDEFGSRIQHSDTPTFKLVPFMFGVQQMAFTIMWPLQDLEDGGNSFIYGNFSIEYLSDIGR